MTFHEAFDQVFDSFPLSEQERATGHDFIDRWGTFLEKRFRPYVGHPWLAMAVLL